MSVSDNEMSVSDNDISDNDTIIFFYLLNTIKILFELLIG